MAEQLKRTFHGCLTCRKRKVRCHGGNPCQNCTRMNITCHSSFDTNLRIRVSTPSGQKLMGTKNTAKTEPEPPKHRHQQSGLNASTPYMGPYDAGRSESFMASFQPQFSSFSFAQPTTTYASELPPTLQLTPPSSFGTVTPELDPAAQYNGLWGQFDFGAIDPDLGRDFTPRVDVGLSTPATLGPVFESFLPHTPVSHQSGGGYPISDSEGSSSSALGRAQEPPKEWVPRRRKRTRKETTTAAQNCTTKAKTKLSGGATSTQEYGMMDEAELFDHFRNCTQEDFINEQDEKWSFNRFVPEFIQKCSPHCPMRLAVLAWTAKHSASEKGASSSATDPAAAADWYKQSSEQIEKLFGMPDPALELGNLLPVTNVAEVIISTSFFLNRYDVLDGDLKAAGNRLERMTRWLAKHTGGLSLSAFACKLLLWACYLQVRISIFSKEHLRFPTLLDVLSGRGDYHLILERSHNFYLDMFGRPYPQERLAEDVERIPAALHLHETFRLLTSILRYRALRHAQSQSNGQDPTGWEELAAVKRTVDDEMQRVEGDFELGVAFNPSAEILRQGPIPNISSFPSSSSSSSTPPHSNGVFSPPTPPHFHSGKLSRVQLHWLTAYAAFMTTKILWSRLIRLDVRTDEASTTAVESILQIALLLRRSEGQQPHARELPSMLWPLPLFVAGIEAVDEVWADWVKLFISCVEDRGGKGEGCGNGRAMLELMEDIRRRQDECGRRIVVTDLMAEKGQGTELFMF